MASNRQKGNLLSSLTVNGELVEDPNDIKNLVVSYFQKHFHEEWKVRPLLGGSFKSISSVQEAEGLEVVFSEQEVWAAIKDCDGNKSPGPDGFNLMAIKKCWKVLKEDIMQFFSEFHENGKLLSGLCSSFITLIPKKDNPANLDDYRPISLVGAVYKILAKVLSKRLIKVLPGIIGLAQLAFTGGGI